MGEVINLPPSCLNYQTDPRCKSIVNRNDTGKADLDPGLFGFDFARQAIRLDPLDFGQGQMQPADAFGSGINRSNEVHGLVRAANLETLDLHFETLDSRAAPIAALLLKYRA